MQQARAALTQPVLPVIDPDPGYLIRNALLGTARFEAAPQEILLAWLLRIPGQLDPAEAARQLLDRYQGLLDGDLSRRTKELRDLMRQVTRYDRSRLRQTCRSGRSRRARPS